MSLSSDKIEGSRGKRTSHHWAYGLYFSLDPGLRSTYKSGVAALSASRRARTPGRVSTKKCSGHDVDIGAAQKRRESVKFLEESQGELPCSKDAKSLQCCQVGRTGESPGGEHISRMGVLGSWGYGVCVVVVFDEVRGNPVFMGSGITGSWKSYGIPWNQGTFKMGLWQW